jgi:hypothetical protein
VDNIKFFFGTTRQRCCDERCGDEFFMVPKRKKKEREQVEQTRMPDSSRGSSGSRKEYDEQDKGACPAHCVAVPWWAKLLVILFFIAAIAIAYSVGYMRHQRADTQSQYDEMQRRLQRYYQQQPQQQQQFGATTPPMPPMRPAAVGDV